MLSLLSLSTCLLSFIILEITELLGALLRVGDPQRLLFVVVEVASVAGALALGDERSFDLKRGRTEM